MAEDAPAPEPDRIEGAPHPRETRALYGQSRAETRFLEAWSSGRLHHGWLLTGPRGTGKATLAYRIARAMLAREDGGGVFGPVPETLDMDPGHPVFRRVAAQGESRLRVLRRPLNDKTGRLATVITVDEVRAVKEFLQFSAPDGGWRVVLADAAEEMNSNAANALLKLLEEPPPRTLLLLVSHTPGRLLPTIRSRVRPLDLAPLGPADLARALAAAGAELPENGEAALAALSGGSAGDALRLMGIDGLGLYATIVDLMRPGGIDRPVLVRLADSAGGRDAEPRYHAILRLTLTLLARLARAGASGTVPDEAAPGEAGLMRTAATQPAQARLWAEAAQRIAAATQRARAVNLDPAQVILDTFLELDAVLRDARAAA